MRRGRPARLPALLATVLLLAAASGCGGHPAPPLASSPVRATPSVPAANARPVNRTVTDPVLGDSVTVLSVVRGAPSAGAPLLLVEVRGRAGTRFTRGVEPAAFTLLEPGGRVDAAEPQTTSALAATYPPIAVIEAGQTATGWLAFAIGASSGLTLRLSRPPLVVTGSELALPAAAYLVPLPN